MKLLNTKIHQKKFLSNSRFSSSQEKINIMFIIDILWGAGGTERHLYYLIKYLNKDMFNCFIVTFDLQELFVREMRREGVKIYHIPVGRFYAPNAFIKAFLLRKIIRENKIDIVQTFHFTSDTYGVFVARLSGVKYIISSRRDVGDIKKKRHIMLNRLVNGLIDKFITVCNRVGERISITENIPRHKQITIYNGIDLKAYSVPDNNLIRNVRMELGIRENDFVVGTVAHFRPEKNYDTFFEAIKLVLASIKELRVIAVGAEELLDHFKHYCSENGMDKIVMFAADVKDVRRYIAVMDVACLVPGSNEGFSNAILEKMAMGKPLIVTDVGGNAEAVKDGENGIVIPPFDYKKLADAIIYLYENPSKRREMGRKSRERVERLFTLDKMIRSHEDLYYEAYKQCAK